MVQDAAHVAKVRKHGHVIAVPFAALGFQGEEGPEAGVELRTVQAGLAGGGQLLHGMGSTLEGLLPAHCSLFTVKQEAFAVHYYS